LPTRRGWNYHIDVISKENLQFPGGEAITIAEKIVMVDAILTSENYKNAISIKRKNHQILAVNCISSRVRRVSGKPEGLLLLNFALGGRRLQ
jgi:hypothetical protein